jgi:hypothetical protein
LKISIFDLPSKMIDGDTKASDPEQDAGGASNSPKSIGKRIRTRPPKRASAQIKMIDGDAEASYSEEEDYDPGSTDRGPYSIAVKSRSENHPDRGE